MKLLLSLSVIILAVTAASATERKLVCLARQGSATQLVVDGSPFIILGGELGNSSASSCQDIERIFPKLRRMNLNTVFVPAYWDLMEPEEGDFDFSLIDKVISEAGKNDLKVVFLWFGAWKNSMSCYAPLWFKEDSGKYPRAVTSQGKPLEIASVFSENVYNADSSAFRRFVSHIKDHDPGGIVLMIQLENEIGMLEDARDYSQAAEREFEKGVPRELTDYLVKNRKQLHPQLLGRWERNGKRKEGSWKDVFGDDIYTDEYFMAWNYARYVERLAEIEKEVLGRPVYVNAAMNSRGRVPGEYPSAGPLAHLKDIWHAGAPSVDILAPDLYDKGFTDWVSQYHAVDNPLLIPEIRREEGNAAQAFYAIGEHDALGFSPFSIENGSDSQESMPVKGYAKLRELMPLLTKYQGRGVMRGLYFDRQDKEAVMIYGSLKITANHYFTLPWDPRATDGSEWPVTGGIVIQLAPEEYIVAGCGMVLKFENVAEIGMSRRLGEDGFIAAGDDKVVGESSESGNQAIKTRGMVKGNRQSKTRYGLGYVDEVAIDAEGCLSRVRRYNGDETHQGRHVRISVDDFRILHVRLYQY